jgi:hypothetical protein
MFGQLSGAGMDPPIDACVQNLAQLRDEGFRRVWISQLPYEPDLLTALADTQGQFVTTRGALMTPARPDRTCTSRVDARLGPPPG